MDGSRCTARAPLVAATCDVCCRPCVCLRAGLQTAGAGRDLAEAQAPAVVPLPSAGGGRLLVWAVGHSSSGVPGAWAAGQHRPGVAVTDLSAAGVRQLADLVQRHKQPGDIALVSGGVGGL